MYLDVHGIERPCVILELIMHDGQLKRLAVLGADTHRLILDASEAIPISDN